jgi:hypothetical protein
MRATVRTPARAVASLIANDVLGNPALGYVIDWFESQQPMTDPQLHTTDVHLLINLGCCLKSQQENRRVIVQLLMR